MRKVADEINKCYLCQENQGKSILELLMHRLGVALVSLLTIAVCLVPFLGHRLCKLNDGTYLTPYRQGNDDAVSCFVNSRSQTITKLGCYPIFYP